MKCLQQKKTERVPVICQEGDNSTHLESKCFMENLSGESDVINMLKRAFN